MRNLLTIFILLFSCNAFAQQYVPFPTNDGATWRYYAVRELDINHDFQQEEQYMTDGDTIINGLTYKKVMLRRHIYDTLGFYDTITTPRSTTHLVANVSDIYYGAYREDNKKIYCIIPSYLNTELLRYDFDTLSKTSFIDSVLVGSSYRKRYDSNIIEGIGWLQSFMFFTNMGEEPLVFLCFSNNGDSYMKDSICTYIFPYGTPTSIDNTIDKQVSHVYPNPFAEAIHIDAITAGTALLYNSAGIKVSEGPLREGKNTIATSALSSGIYMMIVKDKTGQITATRKLVK
jgi:hypothetical protein